MTSDTVCVRHGGVCATSRVVLMWQMSTIADLDSVFGDCLLLSCMAPEAGMA